MILRATAGLVLAAIIALVAGRTRSLAPTGVAAAIVTGTVCAAAGWTWAIMLIAFFATSTALTRLGADRKRSADRIVEKGGARDAVQVLANGGMFALAAALFAASGAEVWMILGAGALAAAAADTWATEIGMLARGAPVSLLTLRPLPAGTSGGVTVLGTVGGIAGAGFVSVLAWSGGWPAAAILGAALGGVAGMMTDSLLGATLQARRWCARCSDATERVMHSCGRRTEPAGGVPWLDNDGVNLAATVAGALVALIAARALTGS